MRKFTLLVALVSVCRPHLGHSQEAPLLSPPKLEAFVDGYMASYLEQAHIAGATVAFIEGDAIVFAKGYGFADVDARVRVDPERTLFRIGSVSKLFVWTAVMQLVENGELNLLADVNEYLTDIEVPEAYGAPVNMVQLMTHTAGFDERVIGLFATDVGAVRPLEDILRDELPARVRPPGRVTSYSNHGTGLAMHVVEQISGSRWEDYIVENILEPLDLQSTSFRQPLPEPLRSRLSKGYRFRAGELVEAPFELVPLAPVGAASSSATDMARFMMAHLRLGELGGRRILREPVARLMQSPLFAHHPSVNGMAHGFIELDMNGERVIGHGGDTEMFHSLFAFFPERGIGVFASFNTAGANYQLFLRAFVDWKFPVDRAPPPMRAAAGLERFTGNYRPTRYPHRTIAKLAALVQTFEVGVEHDHLVTTTTTKRHWFPVEPLVFRERESGATLAFRETVDGRITELFLSEAPTTAFERAPTSENPHVVSLVFGLASLVTMLAVVFWPAAALVRWHYRVSAAPETRIPAIARWSAWLGSLALITFAVGLSMALSDPMQIVYGVPASTWALFALPLAAAPLALVALSGAVRAWLVGRGSLFGRLAFTTVVLAMALWLWQLEVWNLIGFND